MRLIKCSLILEKKLGPKTPEEFLALVDKDGDNRISSDEWMVMFKTYAPKKKLDDPKEFKKLLAEAIRKFSRADKNKDGYIDLAELKEAFED